MNLRRPTDITCFLLLIALTLSSCIANDQKSKRKAFFDSICLDVFSSCYKPQDSVSSAWHFSLPWTKIHDPEKNTKAKIVDEESPEAELMVNLLTGIKASALKWSNEPARALVKEDFEKTDKIKGDRDGNALLPESWYDYMIQDVAPLVFRDLRQSYGMTVEDFVRSLTSRFVLNKIQSPGRSGSLLYFSQDYRFVFKTLRTLEYNYFKSILPSYYEHMKQHPNTLITRIFGLYKVKVPGSQTVPFIVMPNVFSPNVNIHEIFDLKGAFVNRHVPADKAAKSKVPVLQEVNFLEQNKKIFLGSEKRQALLNQLKIDNDFLTQMNLVDYSFIVGIHDLNREKSSVSDIIEESQINEVGVTSSPIEQISREPKSLGEATGPSNRRLPERQTSRFHADNGGYQATDSQNQPLDYIYYFGVIDIFTEYNLLRRLHRVKKFMRGVDIKGISNQQPKIYGPRFYNFIESIVTSE
ncbi:hypothetical protein BKA69DRAFT_1078142 [Paraphysoderma sedebokerense]|nr:hypothetical protein BKA69DRAFT_1078142 [Paraphysoderma sedebokerense]